MRIQILLWSIVFMLIGAIAAQAQYGPYYLPQVANGRFAGGIYKTGFIFFNNHDFGVAARLELTADDGQPLVLTIPGLGTGSNFQVSLEAGGSKFLQTDGSGDVVVGAATVNADNPIGISAIFSIYDSNGKFVTEAGVGSSLVLNQFVIPVNVTNNFNTGLALLNPGLGNASINLTLRDEAGKEAGKTALNLGANGHRARFVAGSEQLFPAISTFRGTLLVQSTMPLAALTLRQNGTPLSFTSLPVADMNSNPEPVGFAHIANGTFDGGSYRTSMLFFNLSSLSTTINLELVRSDGSPFQLTFPGFGTGSSFEIKLEPNASIFLQTDGSGPLATGGATIISPQLIGASAIFSVFDTKGRFQTEAGVGTARPEFNFTIPVDISENFDTGVAFFNPANTVAEVTLRLLRSDGELQGESTSFNLPARHQQARFVSQLFKGVTDFRGSLAISSRTNLISLTLRQNGEPLSYTTLPVSLGTSAGKIFPLLPKTRTGISAAGNVSINEALSAGHKLKGTIYGNGYVSQVAAQSSSGEIYYGQVLGQPGAAKYLIIAPAGSYKLKACFGVPNGTANVTYTDPGAVQVSGEITRDLTLPSINLTSVTGKVTGFESLPTSFYRSIVLNSTDNTIVAQTQIDDSGNYSTQVPPGTYRANLYMPNSQFPGGQGTQFLTIFNFGTFNAGSSPVHANFTIPAISKLSGTVIGQVRAEDRSAPQISEHSCGYFPAYSYSGNDLNRQYQMFLAKDRSYDVSAEIAALKTPASPGQEPTFAGILRWPHPAPIVNLAADSRLDFSAPDLPAAVTISGRLTDESGRAIANAWISAVSLDITGVPNSQLTNSGQTDFNGKYSIAVLSGNNYKLTFLPPLPYP